MRVEFVKNSDGSFKLDEDGKKINCEINNPFDFKKRLLNKVSVFDEPPKFFPLSGKITPLSLENLTVAHKSNLLNLISTFD